MASPISFGDAYLMGKLALRLGRAFTKGRKSAPAEFREVENQLYSLSTALYAFKHAHDVGGLDMPTPTSELPDIEGHQPGEPVVTMLNSCQQTLRHLEGIVNRYGIMKEPQNDDPKGPRLRRWSRDLRANWSRIQWTTEGGGLATLQRQLTLHTNSLNLIIGVANKYSPGPQLHCRRRLTPNSLQGTRLEGHVAQITAVLEEIHTWVINNVQQPVLIDQHAIVPSRSSASDSLHTSISGFHLYSGSFDEPIIVCEHTRLHPEWNFSRTGSIRSDATGPGNLFLCHCPEAGLHNAIFARFKC